MTEETQSPTLEALKRLSSAEDMFAHLGLEPDRHILNVARLHIMKRFGTYLQETDFSGHSEEEVLALTREALARAHDDFVASTPLAEKVFKVFETQAARQANKFVGLDSLKIVQR